ncbi:hypothetical protein diail_11163 [Diaporthe ilicicola]|nr:hypothetical protein diail_11163 [Diaporthe ilicicola]
MGDRSTADPGRNDAGPGAGRAEYEHELNEKCQDLDWRHLPVALSGGLSGVMACTRPALKKPQSPLEMFCHEQQRHERIAFMMRGDEHVVSSKWPIGSSSSHDTSRQPPPPPLLETQTTTPKRCHHQHEDIPMKDAGEASAAAPPNSKPSSSPFRVELEVNGSDNMESDPHLEEIRIAARIRQVALGR